ncbi:hypothetical protein BCR43DRAFT_137345 [Syncephalastrum racemosum]|uniref:Uncharacterized protein n=1 Tax=Syncephalastrum racemosum TaxID=13706 RepID=A0A1X2HLR4_SYNRA|nr:hypothetical protein BCR43DRAFT_137345 [Syncephalastrum racemosum]
MAVRSVSELSTKHRSSKTRRGATKTKPATTMPRPSLILHIKMPDASGQSIPTSLLRSSKIPKRKTSAEPPQELEEGEMVSPSPSPRATPVIPRIESPLSASQSRSSDWRSRHGHRSPRSRSRSRSRSLSPSRNARKRRDEDEYSDSSKRRRHRRDSDDEPRTRHDTSRSRTRRSRSPSPKRSRATRERDSSRDRDRRRHGTYERDASKTRKEARRSSTTTTDRPSPRLESKHTHDDYHSSSGSSNGSGKRRTSTSGTPVRSETVRPDSISRRRPSAGSTASTPSSTGDTASRHPSSSTTATATTPAINASSDTHSPPSPVSDLKNATDPQAESPEQVRAFAVMFKQLATAYKRRADRGGETVVAAIDQVLALLNYVLSFHYQDKQSQSGLQHWESLFPFLSVVLRRLKGRQDMVALHGLCVRMSALVRFYIFSRREPHTRKVASGATDDTAKEATTHAVRTLQDYEMAYSALREADRILSYDGIRQTFPKTFEAICVQGDLRSGITLGGEAGVSTEPMFPLSPFSRLHHAAIMVKACVHEYLKANNVSYSFITDYAEFM